MPPRLWPGGRLPTFELKRKNQAYGILFAVTDAKLDAGIAKARLLLAATDDTPEGHYELRLSATYLGYTPQNCEPFDRLRGACPGLRADLCPAVRRGVNRSHARRDSSAAPRRERMRHV